MKYYLLGCFLGLIFVLGVYCFWMIYQVLEKGRKDLHKLKLESLQSKKIYYEKQARLINQVLTNLENWRKNAENTETPHTSSSGK